MHFAQQLVDAGLTMLREELTAGTSGNLSLRDRATGRIYLTPSGMEYTRICSEDIVVCDSEGSILSGTRRPTIEKALHLAVYRARADVCAIVHAHPVWSTVLSCMGEGVPPVTDEAALTLGAEVVVCPHAPPGSGLLALRCAEALQTPPAAACLLAAHGAVCVGGSMEEALSVARTLERTAEILCRAKSCGVSLPPLPAETIAGMRAFVSRFGGQPKQ